MLPAMAEWTEPADPLHLSEWDEHDPLRTGAQASW
jgi:hypothetical protein